MNNHPCRSCGACCAFFKVSFHWSETFQESHGVPIHLSTQVSPYQNTMLGTDQKNPSCIAFKGVLGKAVACDIYLNRPDCCRTFKASYEDGSQNDRCEQARIAKGLPILGLADWAVLSEINGSRSS